MARAYKVEATNGSLRFAKSVAHARELRDELLAADESLRKKDVSIDEEVDLPTNKADLIDFLNELLATYDGEEEEEEETEEEEEEEDKD